MQAFRPHRAEVGKTENQKNNKGVFIMTMKLTIKQLMEYAEKQKVFAMTPLSTLTELVRQQIIAKIQFEVKTDIDH